LKSAPGKGGKETLELAEDTENYKDENEEILRSLETVTSRLLRDRPATEAAALLERLSRRLAADHDMKEGPARVPVPVNTPYVNTIAAEETPGYPGDLEIEEKITALVRWNALAMVVKANTDYSGIGGHISSFASLSTLVEVGFQHFFRGGEGEHPADQVYFQGHASPGNYARAFLEGRLTESQLRAFRRELAPGGGLSSYPHPYLMPDFWQFPTVSMGLGPIQSIYQARMNQYLRIHGLIEEEPRVFAFIGDGEMDEPESRGALRIAAEEKLENLVWVIDANLQRLDGPVRGNGKIIQELEATFRGAGWNVIKVLWGRDWDELLARDDQGLLAERMTRAVDGDYQKYAVEPGSYMREHFFGTHPDLRAMVDHLTDEELRRLGRGGHDPVKVAAAYQAAVEHEGKPTVILAKTIKGHGFSEAIEASNVTHQQKKVGERELRLFRERFDLPLDEEQIAETPFYRPPEDSPEMRYLLERRKKLGGFLPKREVKAEPLKTPPLNEFAEFLEEREDPVSTTMAAVRLLSGLLRDKELKDRIVPIIPDEARTFGIDALFRQVAIYKPFGQQYEPVDQDHLLYYREEREGRILEEGITEAGAMSDFIAAGTAYASHGVEMIPFYLFYSMFGFQRIGDLAWAAGDIRAKGFLLGATAGRTTLNGEGLQHQDGHSHLLAATHPGMLCYDPAFAFEIAVIVRDGLRRMFAEGEEIMYYLTLYNENYAMPAMPERCHNGILKGIYLFRSSELEGDDGNAQRAQIFGSGPMINEALRAQKILAEKYWVAADVWSATSYKSLRTEALGVDRWNRMHPEREPRVPYLSSVLEGVPGPFVAVSDNMRQVPDQIAPWVPGKLHTLGTDGYGRSDTREELRRFFEVDAESVVITVLHALALEGRIEPKMVSEAMEDLGVDENKDFAWLAV
jgi:pyruvate dehydrogenase E1 component